LFVNCIDREEREDSETEISFENASHKNVTEQQRLELRIERSKTHGYSFGFWDRYRVQLTVPMVDFAQRQCHSGSHAQKDFTWAIHYESSYRELQKMSREQPKDRKRKERLYRIKLTS
jgi:hypothetical protein